MLNFISPMLWTDDLNASITFYTNLLGFTCDAFNETWGWASLHKDNVQIMLAKPNEHETGYSSPGFTGSFYIYTDEVDAWWEKLKDKCTILYPIENFEYNMREFCILDNNGYRIQFGSSVNQDAD